MINIQLYKTNYQYPSFGNNPRVTRNKIKSLIIENKDYEDIAKFYNKSLKWAYTIVEKFKLSSLLMKDCDVKIKVGELKDLGFSLKLISRILCLSAEDVANILYKRAIEKKQVKKIEIQEEVKSKLLQGKSISKIAEEMNSSINEISKIVKSIDKNKIKSVQKDLIDKEVSEVAARVAESLSFNQNIDDVIANNADLKKYPKSKLKTEIIKQRKLRFCSLINQKLKFGCLLKDIANELKCSITSVSRLASDSIKSNRQLRKIQNIAEAERMIAEGASIGEIAKKINVSVQTIYNIVGVEKVQELHQIYLQNRNNKILELRESGLNNVEIAKMLGISKCTVSRIIKKS